MNKFQTEINPNWTFSFSIACVANGQRAVELRFIGVQQRAPLLPPPPGMKQDVHPDTK
jgi:hypothetical protein